ncbi:ExeA family protein [Hephaestia sp. GCM10023244]|uniref:ExeA family protein n=1 Tax=unclassified Hephaestia TaxID=2631281 RepID=UPI002076DB83|nr:AAA family ATPase [Hephaestia sp. MAHUQ-44]MCM8732145.1 AAA family ATPase [Hephaestia sp. MAHUQ-44]
MYEDQYGLSGRPFALTPDPRFWFETATHRKAMAYLGYGLSQGEGFIVVTGDIGAGKTTLVGHLVDTIDPTRLKVITLVSTQMDPEDLLRLVADGLGIEGQGLAKADLLKRIEQGLHAVARDGRRTLLIVDEVQALPTDSLEELRMLSNIQAGGQPLLQIVLLGQPEFRDRLHGSDRLEQLRQRVIAIHHLDPMEPEEIEPYMRHRLALVGWQGKPDFAPDAFVAMHEATGGVPRIVNQLAGRVMLFAAMDRIATIDAEVIDAVIDDLAADVHHPAPQPIADAAKAATVPSIDEAMQRIAMLEARVEDQDAALRRVLTLLVDWVEGGDSQRSEPVMGSSAA